MKAIVTGGAGFIGSWIADALIEKGARVWIMDDLSTGRKENVPPECELLRISVDSESATEAIRDIAPDAIFHQGAQMSVRVSVQDPLHDCSVNVRGTLRIALAAADAGTKLLTLASSGGAVYGEPEVMPLREDHPIAPTSPYGVSKYCGEKYLQYVSQTHGLRTVSLRYGNVYGPRQDPHGEAGVIAIFAGRVLRGESLTINGDGLQTRDYVYVQDVARANLACWEREEARGSINIGTGRATSVLEIAELISTSLGAPIRAEHAPAKAGEQRHVALDWSRARSVLGWEPTVQLADGIHRTATWFADNAGSAA